MTPAEYRSILDALHLSAQEAARLLGVHRVTSHSWASGKKRIQPPAIRLLWLMRDGKVKLSDLEEYL